MCFALASCQKESQVARASREGILLAGNGADPKSLDPQLVSGVVERNILATLMEGLITVDPASDAATPGGAAEEVSPDETATVWTVRLRPEGKWSDGVPVTSQDFAFAYERILSPGLGARYAEMLYFLKGAEDFNKGVTEDFSTVGVEVVDDLTFRLTLRGPTPFFRQILKHYTWYPVPRHVVLKNGWKMDERGNPWIRQENFVGNGPFKLKSYRRNDRLEVERNPHYWNAANVTLNGVRFLPVGNPYTEARMFRDGQLHVTYTAPPEVVDQMKVKWPEAVRQDPYVGTMMYRCNVTRKPLDDARVRRALGLAIDRDELCKHVLRGFSPAYAVTPPMEGYEPPHGMDADPETARRLLAEAGFPGGKGFPRLKILIASRETAATMAQAIQAQWRRELGIDVEIENKEWTAYLIAQQQLDYDIASGGWIGDYLDPLTFLEMWTPGNGNNNTGWESAEFVSKLQESMRETDVSRRMDLLREAERIVLEGGAVLPIAWYSKNFLIRPEVEGWHALLLDDHPYQFLRLSPGKGSETTSRKNQAD
ncbi:MAG: peptide ABC transporter substrate-binding protein [Luteolibacter sp.]